MTETDLLQSWGGLEDALRREMALPKEERCDYSDLFPSQCACKKHRNSDAWFDVQVQQEVFE